MKALLVINEHAGSHAAETIEKALQEVMEGLHSKWRERVTLCIVSDIQQLQAEIERYHHELDRVIAAGGDGTIIEVVTALLPYPHLKLGIIPLGTGNRLASNLGIPSSLKGAMETALYGVPHAIDIGRINNRYFALMAGAGLDADIMDQVHPMEKKTMGLMAYFWKGLHQAFLSPFAVFDIEADDQHVRCRGVGVIVANAGNLLGRYFTLTPGAQPDDGLFDICVLASKNRTDYWATVIQILSQRQRSPEDPGVKHLRARHIRIRSRPRVKVQADGDVIGTTPIVIEALPKRISVLVPGPDKSKNGLSGITDSIQFISDHLRLVIRDLFHI